MKTKSLLMIAAVCVVALLSAPVRSAQAQTHTPKFEVGGQFSLLSFDPFTSDGRRREEYGGGGRFTFNFWKYIAAEAQLDYFPQTDSIRIGIVNVPLFGSKTLGVFGAKAGARGKRFGVFGKARPGFIHFSSVPGVACISAPCPQHAKTNFAFDVGAVLEYYPSRRTVVRFDADDTIIHYQRYVGTNHNAQISAGVGVRF
jgi:hypothetical protein